MSIDTLIADLERAMQSPAPGRVIRDGSVIATFASNAALHALCSPDNIAAIIAEVKRLREDSDRYRWLVNFATSWDGTADSDNMVRLWFYRPDRREVMVVGINLDDAIELAEKERQAVAAVPGHELNYGQRTR